MFLKNFIYLDEQQLAQYVSQVEDGLRRAITRTQKDAKKTGGSLGPRAGNVSHERNKEQLLDEEVDDTGAARFERLLGLIAGAEDDFGWLEVLQESDLDNVRPGTMVDLTAEIFRPAISGIAGPQGMLGQIGLIAGIARLAEAGGRPVQGMPSGEALDAMAAFGAAMPSLIQGEIAESDWNLVAVLKDEAVAGDPEGDVRVVGKVVKTWSRDTWRPLPGLPIISSMPREQRREYERKGPDESAKMMWVPGPAMELDILAIYR